MIEIRQSRNGLGVFATKSIDAGDMIWNFSDCKRYHAKEIPAPYQKDEYLQVADDLYLGPDGRPPDAGDYVNHSCRPNAVLKVDLPLVILVAATDIWAGEEITYDYAVTMKNDDWTMACNCGARECRGVVKEVKDTEQLYGIYAFARVGTDLPKILLLTGNGDWVENPEAAGRWGSEAAVQGVLSKMPPHQEDYKNIWWFTWPGSAVLDQAK